MKRLSLVMCGGLLVLGGPPVAVAAGLAITVHAIDATGIGPSLGTIEATDTPQGLTLTPRLAALPPGQHGFHIHQNPDCGAAAKDGQPVAGLAAGGHFDPKGSGRHLGPYQASGHLGDLPALSVGKDGRAVEPLLAPRLKLADIIGRSILIHGGGDNYADEPQPLGGGGARIACGIVK